MAGFATKVACFAKRRLNVIGFLILLVGIGIQQVRIQDISESKDNAIVKSGRAVAVAGCNRDFVQNEKFRFLLNTLKRNTALSYRNRVITEDQFNRATLFWDSQLATFRIIDCRPAGAITTNAGDVSAPPEPFYPGNPDNPKVGQ